MKRKLNISIDDLSPHPKTPFSVINLCFDLMQSFPEIKFTLFIPTAYSRLGEMSYRLTDYPDFCSQLRSLPQTNFEIGWHGHLHRTATSNDNEFADLSREEAKSVFAAMFDEADRAGLKDLFKPIFRPSAFRMSPASFDICSELGISTLALSSKQHIVKTYGRKHLSFNGKIVYYNINPPYDPLQVYDTMEIMYHACSWDKSYFDSEKKSNLEEFIIGQKEELEFSFLESL